MGRGPLHFPADRKYGRLGRSLSDLAAILRVTWSSRRRSDRICASSDTYSREKKASPWRVAQAQRPSQRSAQNHPNDLDDPQSLPRSSRVRHCLAWCDGRDLSRHGPAKHRCSPKGSDKRERDALGQCRAESAAPSPRWPLPKRGDQPSDSQPALPALFDKEYREPLPNHSKRAQISDRAPPLDPEKKSFAAPPMPIRRCLLPAHR